MRGMQFTQEMLVIGLQLEGFTRLRAPLLCHLGHRTLRAQGYTAAPTAEWDVTKKQSP